MNIRFGDLDDDVGFDDSASQFGGIGGQGTTVSRSTAMSKTIASTCTQAVERTKSLDGHALMKYGKMGVARHQAQLAYDGMQKHNSKRCLPEVVELGVTLKAFSRAWLLSPEEIEDQPLPTMGPTFIEVEARWEIPEEPVIVYVRRSAELHVEYAASDPTSNKSLLDISFPHPTSCHKEHLRLWDYNKGVSNAMAPISQKAKQLIFDSIYHGAFFTKSLRRASAHSVKSWCHELDRYVQDHSTPYAFHARLLSKVF